MSFLKKNSAFLGLSFASLILYIYFAYFLERNQFLNLSFSFLFLFGCYYVFIKKNTIPIEYLVGISILFRLVFLFATPNLSQDFYRFLWDGRMLFNGLNPYLSLPETFINQNLEPVANAEFLYEKMGALNGSHYTNYPPINQLNFFITAIFASKSVFWSTVILRLQLIIADVGILYFGRKILQKLHLNERAIFWYVLNPLVIIELTGNLHFEAVMLFFFVWSIYQLMQNNWKIAGVLFAFSVSTKLITLLFLPIFYQWFVKFSFNTNNDTKDVSTYASVTRFIIFCIIVTSSIILLFLPFYSSTLIDNYLNSVGLWFNNFEFNASFYYIFREIGYWFRGYNEIAVIGKILPIITLLIVLYLSFVKKIKTTQHFFNLLLLAISCYYLFSTTIHPWYITTLVLLSCFSNFKFPIAWSLVVILSYVAYANHPFKENLYLIFAEYVIVFSFLGYELRKIKQNKL